MQYKRNFLNTNTSANSSNRLVYVKQDLIIVYYFDVLRSSKY